MITWHEAQSEHNRKLAQELDANEFPDWVVTASFYAALHLVDAAIITEYGLVEPHSHAARRNYIARSSCLRAIAVDYQWLYDRCHEARYRRLHSSIRHTEVMDALSALEGIAQELLPLS